MQNLVYALIQVIHNLGAATIVGIATVALWPGAAALRARLAVFIALAWALQGASGAGFGLATYSFEGHLPDIHGIAVIALLIKIACVICGFFTAIAYVKYHAGWDDRRQVFVWRILFVQGATALGAAAFLRWFS